MAATSGASSATPSPGAADGAVASMEAAFAFAIEQSARITALTTVEKAKLDAAKQRPQN